ncbi:MAG: alpha/beta hydrolase, partial [Paracoccaceae bacterium]|nr:alpha/beta hydrolase [Paracoccaceae bacterium]
YYEAVRTGGVIPSDDPRYMPMQDSHFDGLPPTVAVSAECDPLCDDAERYCALLNDAGGRALCLREAGLVHGYLRARRTVARAQVSFDRILKSVALLGAGQMPTSDDLDS